MKKALAFLMAAVMLMSMLTACGNKDVADDTKDNNDVSTAEADQAAADKVAALIDAIYVQERTEETDAQCEAAKAAWDALTDAQKELEEMEIEGESGGGMVKVVCNGKKVISSISIDPKAVDPDDVEMLEDLIVAAINDAYSVADEEYEDKMGMFGGMI